MKRVVLIAVGVLALAAVVSAQNGYGPGRVDLPFIAGQHHEAGTVTIHNNNRGLLIDVQMDNGWEMIELHVHAGWEGNPIPVTRKGNVIPGKFEFKYVFDVPALGQEIYLDFEEDLQDFRWGEPYEEQRTRFIAVFAEVKKYDDGTGQTYAEGAWAYGDLEFEQGGWARWLKYEMAHKKMTHIIDSPVSGLRMISPTEDVLTDDSGAAPYFPGESGSFYLGNQYLGTTLLEHKVSPLDFFPLSDTDDPRVINMAVLLQSLDAGADPKPGITITPEVRACFDQALATHGAITDWSDDDQVNLLVDTTFTNCSEVADLVLAKVSPEDAKANLDRSLDSTMFRKNVSKTPDLGSSKAKLNIMGVWFPAFRANGDPAIIEYFDEDGSLIRTAEEAKPIVITYTDADPVTGAHDTMAAVSRDDGQTWKRRNISRSADRSSMSVLKDGTYYDYPGATKKPVFQVKGNKILIAWSSKYCKGGKPAYSIDVCPDEDPSCTVCSGYEENEVCGPDYIYDDPYWADDIFGVAGPQRSHDYTDDGFPEVGELPYSCVWVARGVVATAADVSKGLGTYPGDIVWFKPERLTSGRRDALQIFMGGASGAGFAVAWQEDPFGLRPGKFLGPGHGWSGATTNHKTDIWYSHITWGNFAKVDTNFVIGGDPEHDDPDFVGRPKALVPMSLPVRLSDNDVVNTDNLLVELGSDGYPVTDPNGDWTPIPNPNADNEGEGTHRYGYEIDGLCDGFYEFINYQDELKRVCITEDGRLLDGDTGASRVNTFLQTYTKPDGTKSAWAIINYEETKGAGAGSPEHDGEGDYGDEYIAEQGKNVIYHSFDFQNPDLVSAGDIVNLPERDIDGNLLYLREDPEDGGGLILDYLDQPQLAYENSRRARFILQGKGAIKATRTVMNIVYKEGQEGSGRPSDIMLRRVVVPEGQTGNPYRFDNIICDAWETAANGLDVCVDGTQNMSSVTPTVTTESQGDPEQEDPYGAVKVVEWVQTVDNFDDASYTNPYEDARAHRGQIRGDVVTMGYSYTPNWAAARNGNDKYDFFVRRSFDGGQTWTTDPAGEGVTHCRTYTYPSGTESAGTKVEVCTTYDKGYFEEAHNLSQLPNAKSSVIEPRIVCPPGTIKVNEVWTGITEDKQDPKVCYVAYGTSTNPKKDPVTGAQDDAVPMDLHYSFTQDQGESFVEVAWDVNPESEGNFSGETIYRWDFLAKGGPEQGEVQLRSTPDGSRFYSCWLEEGEEGSDIIFRRIMSPEFLANLIP